MATNNISSLNAATVPALPNKSQYPSVATSCKVCSRDPFPGWWKHSWWNVSMYIARVLECGHGRIQVAEPLMFYGISLPLNEMYRVSRGLWETDDIAVKAKAWQILYQMSDLTQQYNLTNNKRYTVPALQDFLKALGEHNWGFKDYETPGLKLVTVDQINCFTDKLQNSPSWKTGIDDTPLASQVLCGMFHALLVRSFKLMDEFSDEFKLILPIIGLFYDELETYIEGHRLEEEEELTAAEQQ